MDAKAAMSTEDKEDDGIESLEEAYCWKHHLVSSNFSGISNYNVTVNPKHVEVSDTKCADYWRYLDIEMFTVMELQFLKTVKSYTGQQKDCVKKVIKDGHIAESVYKARAIGDAKLGAK